MRTDMTEPTFDVDAILAAIEALVRFESPTSHRIGVNAVLDEITSQFDHSCVEIDRSPSEGFGDILRVKARHGSSEPGILVLSHVDTVHPLGTLATRLPFRREGDKVFGPGIYDMKAGFAIAIAAFDGLCRAGIPTSRPVTFLFTPDEEVGSPISRQTIEREAAGKRYVLVTEPARDGGKIVTARKGVGRFVIRAVGVPAHAGSSHQKGRSAIRAMAKLITEIEGFTDYARGITTNVGLIGGGTGVNVVPEECTIEVDLRICDLETASEMIERFEALACAGPDIEIIVSGEINRPPFARDERIDELFAQASVIAERVGFKLASVPLAGGGSDGNFTANMGIATLDGLGVDGDGAHTLHEHILVSSIIERTTFMARLMTDLA